MRETCRTCHTRYEVTPDNAKLALFMSYPPANHVVAICSGCGATEHIYLSPVGIMKLMGKARFPIVLDDKPSAERRRSADIAWDMFDARQKSEELPEAPRAWLRELHDTLREFGNES
jgi:hypothetical protein